MILWRARAVSNHSESSAIAPRHGLVRFTRNDDHVCLIENRSKPFSARFIPVLRGTGKFSSLISRFNSLFGRAGNFGGRHWNHLTFCYGFAENRPESEDLSR
jgi:hypothetical protein